MEVSDKSLLEAHCQGDKEAFSELVRRYGAIVLGYLTKLSGGRGQAEDLFQETFKRVHEKAYTLRSSRFKPWLFTIATRVALDGMRRKNRRRTVSLDEKLDCSGGGCGESDTALVVDDNGGPAEEAMRAEQKEQVRRAVALLPERQRATLVLAYYQQLTYREVAEVMDCSIGTVKAQMYRAVRTLAVKLPTVGKGLE